MAPDGTLYFGDTAKDLIALTPAPLAPVTDWELVAWGDDGISYGFAFAHDDAVYFGTYSGRLICMKWTPAPVSP
jgi:sugar lactone lactonase YvrE